MREYSTPFDAEIAEAGSLADDIVRNAETRPDHVAFSRKTEGGWQDVTTVAFLDEVRAVAKGLVAAGIDVGDRIGLVAGTRYEWTLFDYAIWYAGAVTVPIYKTSSAEQLEGILADSGASGVVTESVDGEASVKQLLSRLPAMRQVWTIDQDAAALLASAGADITDAALEDRRAGLTPESAATIIYTSGTTDQPRGCVLTHGNFLFEAQSTVTALGPLFGRDDASTLIVLPLAHVFARLIQVGAVRAGVRLGHCAGLADLSADLRMFAPTFILAVPRVFEKLFTTASQHAAADGRGVLFDRASTNAIAFSRALDRGKPGPVVAARHAMFDRRVFGELRERLGGRCEYAISGGAPLGDRLAHFYRGIGLTVLEGYGLTETTAAVTVNLPGANKVGTVGRPIPGTTVRISDDGELLVRGGQVFAGYWSDEPTTLTAMEDGWLRTGDLAEIDDEGFVRVTGRMKEILVTVGGKNVAPAMLEERIREHPLVSQCMVVGDGRPFIGALVTIDREAFRLWSSGGDLDALITNLQPEDPLHTEIQNAVDAANRAVSQAESIRRFRILPIDWSEEAGQLTPSLKLRRQVIMREFREDLESLYSGD